MEKRNRFIQLRSKLNGTEQLLTEVNIIESTRLRVDGVQQRSDLRWVEDNRKEMEVEKVEGQIVVEVDALKQGELEEAQIGDSISWLTKRNRFLILE